MSLNIVYNEFLFRYKNDFDDYSVIMVKALADRVVEVRVSYFLSNCVTSLCDRVMTLKYNLSYCRDAQKSYTRLFELICGDTTPKRRYKPISCIRYNTRLTCILFNYNFYHGNEFA